MTNAGEEAAFLWQCTGVRYNCKSVHLKAIVVVEAERLVLDDALVELESAGSKTVAAARVTAVEDWHVVFLCHRIDGVEETEEVLLSIDILLTMSAEKNVFDFLEAEALVNV